MGEKPSFKTQNPVEKLRDLYPLTKELRSVLFAMETKTVEIRPYSEKEEPHTMSQALKAMGLSWKEIKAVVSRTVDKGYNANVMKIGDTLQIKNGALLIEEAGGRQIAIPLGDEVDGETVKPFEIFSKKKKEHVKDRTRLAWESIPQADTTHILYDSLQSRGLQPTKENIQHAWGLMRDDGPLLSELRSSGEKRLRKLPDNFFDRPAAKTPLDYLAIIKFLSLRYPDGLGEVAATKEGYKATPVVEVQPKEKARAEPEPHDGELEAPAEPARERPVPPAEPKPKATPKPEPRPAPKPEPEPEPKVEPDPEPRPEPKPEPRVEPKPEIRLEPKVEPRPEPRVEPKPAPVVAPLPAAEPASTGPAAAPREAAPAEPEVSIEGLQRALLEDRELTLSSSYKLAYALTLYRSSLEKELRQNLPVTVNVNPKGGYDCSWQRPSDRTDVLKHVGTVEEVKSETIKVYESWLHYQLSVLEEQIGLNRTETYSKKLDVWRSFSFKGWEGSIPGEVKMLTLQGVRVRALLPHGNIVDKVFPTAEEVRESLLKAESEGKTDLANFTAWTQSQGLNIRREIAPNHYRFTDGLHGYQIDINLNPSDDGVRGTIGTKGDPSMTQIKAPNARELFKELDKAFEARKKDEHDERELAPTKNRETMSRFLRGFGIDEAKSSTTEAGRHLYTADKTDKETGGILARIAIIEQANGRYETHVFSTSQGNLFQSKDHVSFEDAFAAIKLQLNRGLIKF